ncbi:hypothetical protein HY745_12830 [Candidatus Desantisbacteria bacterium]|nr:hypothetical protein [Candidatus Desantisbacteria bacterium]
MVSNPPEAKAPNTEYMLWVTSAAEEVSPGTMVTITIHVKNNSDADLSGGRIFIDAGHVWRGTIETDVNIPAHTETSFTYSREWNQSGTFFVILFDGVGKKIASGDKGIWVINPEAGVTLSTDKTTYRKGSIVNIYETTNNLASIAYDCIVKTYIVSPGNIKIYDNMQLINLADKENFGLSYSVNLPADCPFGTYIVYTDIFDTKYKKIGGNLASFTVPYSEVNIGLNLPETWKAYFDLNIDCRTGQGCVYVEDKNKDNKVSFLLSNSSIINIDNAKFTIKMKDPEYKNYIFNSTIIVDLPANQSANLDFYIGVQTLHFGDYILEYNLIYGTKEEKGEEIIPCNVIISDYSLDKTWYSIKDNIDLTFKLLNVGKFELPISVTHPEGNGILVIDEGIILPSNSVICNLKHPPNPEYITPGIYKLNISADIVRLDCTWNEQIFECCYQTITDTQTLSDIDITIPDYNLEFNLPSGTFDTLSTIPVTTTNIGGVAFHGNVEITLRDKNFADIYTKIENNIELGTHKWDIPIPHEILSGEYTILAYCYDSANKIAGSANSKISINGTDIDLNVSTDKEIYTTDENITSNFVFNVKSGSLENVKFSYELIQEQGAIQSYTGISLNDVVSMAKEQNGTMWFGIDGGGVIKYQNTGAIWTQYTTNQGLENNSVQCVLVDESGDKWFGTHNGLTKFNGTNLRTYTKKDGLSGNDIISIIQDKYGVIWAGTNNGGISRFEGNIWNSVINPIENAEIRDIVEDSVGAIWFATDKGISNYNNGSWLNYDSATGLNTNNITCLYADNANNVWCGTWGNGVLEFNGTEWKKIDILSGISNLFIRDITGDDQSNIWAATDYGLNKIGGHASDLSIQKIFKEAGLLDNKIESLQIDSSGKLWVGTAKGLNRLDIITNAATAGYSTIPNHEGQSGLHIFSLLQDANALWIGTENGITKYDSTGWTNFSDITNKRVTSIAQDSQGYLWLGTWGGGILKINKNQNTIVNRYKRADGLLSDYINSIYISPDGNIWSAAWLGGLSKFNGTTWVSYTKADGLGGETVYSIAREAAGIYWFVTDDGLTKFDGTTWKNHTILNGLPMGNISSIAIDSTNTKWIGTRGRGIIKYNNTVNTVYTKADGLSDNYILQVNVDNNGKVWGATNNGGISVYNGNSWETIDNERGLPDNKIFSLSINSGKTWLGSFGGLILGAQPGNIILEKNEFINITSSFDMPITLDKITTPGKIYLKSKILTKKDTYNGITKEEQIVDEAVTSFYVIDKNQHLIVTLNTDKIAYKPNEPIKVIGKVINNKGEDIAKVTLNITKIETGEILYTDEFPLNASSIYSFSFTFTASSTFTLQASASASPAVIIFEKIIIAEPELRAELNVPEFVGRKPFNATLKLENIGQIDANITCDFGDKKEEILLPKGKTIFMTGEIIAPLSRDENGEFKVTANISGDVEYNIFKKTKFKEEVNFLINAQEEYSEGQIEIPYSFTNTGLVDSEVKTEFNIVDSNQNTINMENKIHYIPIGQTLSNKLHLNLPKGEYTLSYKEIPGNNAEYVINDGQINFVVKKYNDLDMDIISNSNTTDGKINLNINISNNGINDFSGYLYIESGFYISKEEINISKETASNLNYSLTPSGINHGQSNIAIFLIQNGKVILQKNVSADIYAPAFEFVSIPHVPVYRLGKLESISFIVKNTGNLQGEAEINFTMLDILNNSQRLWLLPGEDGTVSFEFMMPDDMEAKEHKAQVSLCDRQNACPTIDIPFTIEGIKLNVTASFDKEYYAVGETARLTMNVENQDTTYMASMFARVNYHAFDSSQNFTLTGGTSTLQFDIPVDKFNGEKVFYGVYMSSGRSIWLNTIYLYEQKSILNLTTNKQVYKPGETVFVTATSAYPGILSYSSFDNKADISINGSASFSFVLPQKLTAGTYGISYTFSYEQSDVINQLSGTHSYDVDGISIKIVECNLDKGQYNSNDTIKTYINIESNVDINTKLNAEVISPDNQSKVYVNTYAALTKGDNKINLAGSLTAQVPGIHRLVYSFYDQDETLSLAGGFEAFDVGDMVLAGLSADKYDYPEGYETVYITANFYSQGQNTGNFKLYKDVQTYIDEQVALSGFENRIYKITPSETGDLKLVGELETGSLKSTKEINFAYGSNLPDLVMTNFMFSMPEEYGDEEGRVTIGVKNIGKTGTAQEVIASVSGNSISENINFGTIASNCESAFIYKFNIKGISTIQFNASVDIRNLIREYHENNNDAQPINISIPGAPQINPMYAYINDTTAIISGMGAPGTQVIIYLTGRDVKFYVSTLVNGQGEFTASLNTIEGENTVWVRTIDNYGNKSLWSNQEKFIRDTEIPQAPTLTSPQDGEVLYNPITTIKGTSEPNSKVTMKIGINTYVTNADENGEYIFSFIQLEENTNILVINAEDRAGNISSSKEASLILKSVNLNVNKNILNTPRVLILEIRNPGIHNEIIDELFESTGINYYIANTKDKFKSELRTGKYNVYMLMGNDKSIELIVEKELKERVYGGEGLVVSGEKSGILENMQEVLGIKNKGYLSTKNNIVNFVDTTFTKQNTLATIGKAEKAGLITGQKLGYIKTGKEGSYCEDQEEPAVIVNNYGYGKVVYFTIDLLESSNSETKAQIKEIVNSSIKYVAPETVELELLGVVPIGINIENKGKSVELKVTETVPEEVKITGEWVNGLMSEEINAKSSSFAWQFKLLENEKKILPYYLQVPDTKAVYTTVTEISYLDFDSSYRWYGKYLLDIQINSDMKGLIDEIANDLNALALIDKEQQIGEKIVGLLQKIQNEKNKEKNIRYCLKAIDSLSKIKSIQVEFIRYKLIKLLKVCEKI